MQTAATSSGSLADAHVFNEVTAIMERGVEDGIFPGAVLLVGVEGQVALHRSFGKRFTTSGRNGPHFEGPAEMQPDTVFDIAALTNIVVTTTLIMKLVEAQQLRLEDRVSRYLAGFGVHGKSAITVGHLLAHAAGLPAWIPFFEELVRQNAGARMGILTSRGARQFVFNTINRAPLKHEPGTRQLYSDPGFMLLGHLIEELTGVPLDRAAQRLIFQPLGMKSTSYIDLSMIKRRGIHPVTDLIAPTEECSWRKRVLCGEVHDDNAWAMGGIAGHSGVFSTAADLHRFAVEMLKAWQGHSSFLDAATVRSFWQGLAEPLDGSWRYGWDSPGEENEMRESGLSAEAVGESGFTGCSLWLEPARGIDIILMSNRVHPSRNNRKIRAFRPTLHAAVMQALRP